MRAHWIRRKGELGYMGEDYSQKSSSGNKDSAKDVGIDIAEKLIKLSVNAAYFDRGGYIYHGRVQALAEGAREAGLKF